MFTRKKNLSTGLAMFAMFFGAGNAIFPLMLGYQAQNKTIFAILGLLLSAVVVPFAGLIAMILFDGDQKHFFYRIGAIPGFLLAFLIMALLGPFGATPRCVAMAYSTLKVSFPDMSPQLFNGVACAIIFGFTYKRGKVLDLIGYFLTPLLVAFLAFVIAKGLLFAKAPIENGNHPLSLFIEGWQEGYKTMDLLSAFFFAPVVLASLKAEALNRKGGSCVTTLQLFRSAFYASCIGAALLAATYIGFCLLASFHGSTLQVASKEQLLGAIAVEIAGSLGGVIVSVIVALACLTTAIALTTVFAEFFQKFICKDKICYESSLLISLCFTYLFSIMEFSAIAAFLEPILLLCYPALIVLTLLNIMHRLKGVDCVKVPFFMTFLLSLFFYAV